MFCRRLGVPQGSVSLSTGGCLTMLRTEVLVQTGKRNVVVIADGGKDFSFRLIPDGDGVDGTWYRQWRKNCCLVRNSFAWWLQKAAEGEKKVYDFSGFIFIIIWKVDEVRQRTWVRGLLMYLRDFFTPLRSPIWTTRRTTIVSVGQWAALERSWCPSKRKSFSLRIFCSPKNQVLERTKNAKLQ